jgi:Protein of unknown function (DUF2380)
MPCSSNHGQDMTKLTAYKCAWLILLTLMNNVCHAKSVVAVLDFELRDLTVLPGSAAELERTASLRARLENALRAKGCEIAAIPSAAQREANAGFGYLFDHHDIGAQLGQRFKADYVVIGRLHKPSYLFVYLMAHLVDVHANKLTGDFLTEIKGTDARLTDKGVRGLSDKIADSVGCMRQQ